jgi:glycosidase
MKKISILLFAFCIFNFAFSQGSRNKAEVYPTNWWVGMKMNKIQLMFRITSETLIIPHDKLVFECSSSDVKILKVHHPENRHYLFVDVEIAKNAKPQKVEFRFVGIQPNQWYCDFELKPRRSGNGTAFAQGVRSQDLIYLIMPDRFANGDYSNDKVPGMRDQSLNRDSIWLRHGGDIQGVIDHLDYLKDLGVTTVWLTPVFENDMKRRTEHGYAITNHYKVDPRLGTNDLYRKLGDELHKRGMKLMQDAVYNHMGLYNFLQEDPPSKDWVHQWPEFTHPNYKDQTLFDPYVAEVDKKYQTDGWFDRIMPDINQKDPYFANFLIENAIWCVEEFGVDGWRIDTYIYCDLDFMNRCNKALTDEYPNITMFGECWVNGTANEAYFTQNNMNTKFKSNLIGVTDFQWLFYGISPAIKEGKVDDLYQVLSNDFLYKNPMNNAIFLDNHDLTRFYSEVGEDIDKLKMGIGCLLTSRGIPEIYYGTEVLMSGAKGGKTGDGLLRKDFPGGWREDKGNKFTAAGRTEKENEIFNWTKVIANFRKNASAIKTGKLMQYVPQNGTYVYFRYDDKQTVMCVMNTSLKDITIDLSRFSERMNGFRKGFDPITGKEFGLENKMIAGPKSFLLVELRK